MDLCHFCKSSEHEGLVWAQEFQGQLGLQYVTTKFVKQCHIPC